MNRVETALMISPFRAAILRHFEARRLLSMGGRMSGGRALEVGCGCGVGVELILDLFGAERVDAFDLDQGMVELARRRLAKFADRVTLKTGDVTAIDADDAAYDAVFDFGVMHHVPNWRDALREVYRVLKPGGRFYMEEVFMPMISHPLWRRLLGRGRQDYFRRDSFCDGLTTTGFEVLATCCPLGLMGWFVARRPAGPPSRAGLGPGSVSETRGDRRCAG